MPTINPQAVRGPVTAVPVVAGTGVRFREDVENNRVVAELDETVLWSNDSGVYFKNGVTLSESRLNFEYIRIFITAQNLTDSPVVFHDIVMIGVNRGTDFVIMPNMPFNNAVSGANFVLNWKIYISATETTMASTAALYWGKTGFDGTSTNPGSWTQGSNANVPKIYKVVGINRVASA